jgi:hypothetical protein
MGREGESGIGSIGSEVELILDKERESKLEKKRKKT